MFEWRQMYMDLWRKDGMILGFVKMVVDLLWTDLVVYNPRMKMPGSLSEREYRLKRGT
jgi:hypothetical protein